MGPCPGCGVQSKAGPGCIVDAALGTWLAAVRGTGPPSSAVGVAGNGDGGPSLSFISVQWSFLFACHGIEGPPMRVSTVGPWPGRVQPRAVARQALLHKQKCPEVHITLLDARSWGQVIPPIWDGAQYTAPHNIAKYLEPGLLTLGKLQGPMHC